MPASETDSVQPPAGLQDTLRDGAMSDDEARKEKEDDETGMYKGYDPEDPVGARSPGAMTDRLHFVMVVILLSNLICLLAVVPTRSWGIGKWEEVSVGPWAICGHGRDSRCDEDLDSPAAGVRSQVGKCWAEHSGAATAAGVFGIFAIIANVLVLVVQVLEYKKAGRVKKFLAVQTVLCAVLMLLLLISWAIFAGFRDAFNSCANESSVELTPGYYDIWYGWGFVFMVAMWLVMLFFTIIYIVKAMDKRAPCGL